MAVAVAVAARTAARRGVWAAGFGLALLLLLPRPASGAEHASAFAQVPDPPAVVWALLTDFEGWRDIFPNVSALSVARIDDRRARLRTRTRIAGRVVRYTLAASIDPDALRLECRLDSGERADIALLDSTWQVWPTPGGGSQVELHVRSSSGLLAPAFLERRVTERSTQQSMNGLVAALAERRFVLAADD